MSPVNLLRAPSKPSQIVVRHVGGNGAFVITYAKCDRPTLRTINSYQQTIRSGYPGWMTLFSFQGTNRGCELHVFPVSDLPVQRLSRTAKRWQMTK